MPNWPEIISAAISDTHATPMPTARPVNTFGSAPGSTTCHSRRGSLAPSERAARSSTGSIASTPCTVFSRIGKNEPMKVMKTMLTSLVGHSMMDIGTHAMAGMGRSTSIAGIVNCLTRG